MRDFRDAKAMARALRGALAAKGLSISHGESLELIAKLFGLKDWNTLSARIQAAEAWPQVEAVSPAPPPTREVGFSAGLQQALHRAVAAANQRRHAFATLEHLLFGLADEEQAAEVMSACGVDPAELKREVESYIDAPPQPAAREDQPASPTAGFQRVIQRAVIHGQASGRKEVTGANVLVAMFSEPESHAVYWLAERGMTRLDAVNFIVHGIRKSAA
jgi:hypothetical protein